MRRLPLGSPPRMRGKAKNRCRSCPLTRITPACAGKSAKAKVDEACNKDHPRVCGEKALSTFSSRKNSGSPPRVRGKVQLQPWQPTALGITPAYAGKRRPISSYVLLLWDHPRVCGEKPGGRLRELVYPGSPPRMRGKDGRTSTGGLDVGITPACAGKSARRQAPQMRLGWSPPPCTGRQCRTRKSTHARRARIPVPAHTPAPQ